LDYHSTLLPLQKGLRYNFYCVLDKFNSVQSM